MSELLPVTLSDFTGGLNTRATAVGLADNESPDMLNMEVDPRVGFATRRGWQRWNEADIVSDPTTWHPRHAKLHTFSDGSYKVYVANQADSSIYVGNAAGEFTQLAATASAMGHVADFAPWGDDIYISCGNVNPTVRIDAGGTESELPDAAFAFNDDYTTPEGTFRAPQADYVEAHAGYLWVAGTREGGQYHPNRLRWSHPSQPGNWATLDFLDIERGGGRITGLMAFGARLLIFKTDSMWALYGYDLASWQLEEVSTSIGLPHLGALARSESAVYFFSQADLNGVYGYNGQGAPVHISERLRPAMESISDPEGVFVGWAAKRLWVATNQLSTEATPIRDFEPPRGDVYCWDPEVGDGAWTRFQPASGSLGPLVERSDVSGRYPLGVMRGDSGTSCVVRLDFRGDARDVIAIPDTIYFTDAADGNRLADVTDASSLIQNPDGDERCPFRAYYRTAWQTAGWPERRKSWLRPRYIVRVPTEDVLVRADAFWDYDFTEARRSSLGLFTVKGGVFWRDLGAAEPDGFDWGDGSLWGFSTASGSALERSAIGLGVNRSVSVRLQGADPTLGVAWAVESIHLKTRLRRFTT